MTSQDPTESGPPSAGRGRPARAAVLGLTLAMAVAACTPRPSDVELLIPINPLCTTCDDFIRCESAAPPGEATGAAAWSLYHLRPKTFFAQIATILDYLLQLFRERTEDLRPLTIHAPGAGMTVSAEAVTDLTRHRISVPGGWIDQVNGEWHDTGDRVTGQCRLLPIAEGRKQVKELRGATAP